MDKLTPELARILLKRITAAIERAKYEPASVAGHDGSAVAAAEVIRPYLPAEPKEN